MHTLAKVKNFLSYILRGM